MSTIPTTSTSQSNEPPACQNNQVEQSQLPVDPPELHPPSSSHDSAASHNSVAQDVQTVECDPNMPEPAPWASITVQPAQAGPPPPPSTTGGLREEAPDQAVMSKGDFLRNSRKQRAKLHACASDKKLPREIRELALKAMEKLDMAISTVGSGEVLPDDQEVVIGSGNLLRKRKAVPIAQKKQKQRRRQFDAASDDDDQATDPDPEEVSAVAPIEAPLETSSTDPPTQSHEVAPPNPFPLHPAAPERQPTPGPFPPLAGAPEGPSSPRVLQPADMTSAPAGILRKFQEQLGPILDTFALPLGSAGYNMAVKASIHLFNLQSKDTAPFDALPQHLPQTIRFKTCATGITEWVFALEASGSNPFSCAPHEPFFSPDILSLPTSLDAPIPSGPGFHLHPMLMLLAHPKEYAKCQWARMWFQAVSLVSRDVTTLPMVEAPKDPQNESQRDISVIKYLIACLDSNEDPAITDVEPSKELQEEGGNFKALNNVIDKIILMLIAFALLRTKQKLQTQEGTSETDSSYALLPRNYTQRPAYHILAAYLTAGVRGLLLIPNDQKNLPITHSLELISLVSRMKELQPKEVQETIWRRTHAYIVKLIHDCFFSPSGFTHLSVSRFNLAKCLVLDFSEYWLASNTESAVFNVPRRTQITRQLQL